MSRSFLIIASAGAFLVCCGCTSLGGFHGEKWYAGETIDLEDLWQATDRAMRFHSGAGGSEKSGDLSGQMKEVDRLSGYLETYHIPLDREHMGSREYSRKFRAKIDKSGPGWQVTVFVGVYRRPRIAHLDPEEKWTFQKREPDIEESIIGTIQAQLQQQYGTKMGTRKKKKGY